MVRWSDQLAFLIVSSSPFSRGWLAFLFRASRVFGDWEWWIIFSLDAENDMSDGVWWRQTFKSLWCGVQIDWRL